MCNAKNIDINQLIVSNKSIIVKQSIVNIKEQGGTILWQGKGEELMLQAPHLLSREVLDWGFDNEMILQVVI